MRKTKCVTIDSETHKKLQEIADEWGMTIIDAVGVIIDDEYERAVQDQIQRKESND